MRYRITGHKVYEFYAKKMLERPPEFLPGMVILTKEGYFYSELFDLNNGVSVHRD